MGRKFVPAKPRSNSDIEALTMKIVTHFQPAVLNDHKEFNTEEFFDLDLERLTGVATDYQQLDPGIYGYTDTQKNLCVISRDLADDPQNRNYYRSTAAHEIGHAVLHVRDYKIRRAILHSVHKKGHNELRLYNESEIPLYKNPEWQAWRFAGALLMPACVFRDAVNYGKPLKALSQQFGVNQSFVMTRARALKISLKN